MPRLLPKPSPDEAKDSPPMPVDPSEIRPSYVVLRVDGLYDRETGHTYQWGSHAPLSSRRVREFAAERPDLCQVGFEELPCDTGWALAYHEWATAREAEAAKRKEAERQAAEKAAKEQEKRDAAHLAAEAERVRKWNEETAAQRRREQEAEQAKHRAAYERRKAAKQPT